MERVALAVVLAALAVAVAFVLRRRQSADAPTQRTTYLAPAQLDRSDFPAPEVPWLVAVFTSSTCTSCASMAAKAKVLTSPQVAVAEIEVTAQPGLHRRYSIEAVPITVIADHDGVVRASFVGPVSATDLWAACAEVREPGSTPRAGHCAAEGDGPAPGGDGPPPG
jgi:hypothetical protein